MYILPSKVLIIYILIYILIYIINISLLGPSLFIFYLFEGKNESSNQIRIAIHLLPTEARCKSNQRLPYTRRDYLQLEVASSHRERAKIL